MPPSFLFNQKHSVTDDSVPQGEPTPPHGPKPLESSDPGPPAKTCTHSQASSNPGHHLGLYIHSQLFMILFPTEPPTMLCIMWALNTYIYIYKIMCWKNNVANQIQDSWTCSFTRRMEHTKEVVFPPAQEDCRNWVHPFTAPTVTVTAWIPLRWPSGKESACQCRRCGFSPWIGKILWRRKLQPTPVFLPWKSHGQRSLVGYRPWSHKE